MKPKIEQSPVGEIRKMAGNFYSDSKNNLFTLVPVGVYMKPKTFWLVIHNLIAHPLLITGTRWATRFHDWTADKM